MNNFLIIIFKFQTEFDCPEDGTCSNQGICDDSSGTCQCNEGFEGSTCKGNDLFFVGCLINSES